MSEVPGDIGAEQAGAAVRPLIRRPRLMQLVLGRPEPIVLIEAGAGMGKSVLLRQLAEHLGVAIGALPGPGGTGLIDVGRDLGAFDIPDMVTDGRARLIIVRRTGQAMAGLARAEAYGAVGRIGAGQLRLTLEDLIPDFGRRGAQQVLAETGGWPLLLGPMRLAGAALGPFLAEDVLAPMAVEDLFGWRDRLVTAPEEGEIPVPAAIAGLLGREIERELERRECRPREARAIAREEAVRGRVTDAILSFQRGGFLDEALERFEAGGGRFYLYHYGTAAFDAVLGGFPESYWRDKDTLVTSLAMQALKRGEIARARRLVADRFGARANDIDAVFSDWERYSTDFLAFRVVMLIYEDIPVSEALLEKIFGILAHFDVNQHLLRGSFYNSVLEFYIRGRRFAAAEDVASRAAAHYEAAKAPLLAFYIGVHQAIIALMTGDAKRARQHAAVARERLSRIGFDSPGDQRLLTLLDACVGYESGHAEALANFLSTELDDFVHGEIWPSLVEFVLLYGSQALSEHFSTLAARGFLDRWRVHQVSDRQFGALIELREVAVLQNANRWREASDKLAMVPSRITHSWVAAAGEQLQRLETRDDIMLSLAWLRHLVNEAPTRPWLAQQLEAMHGNLNLTGRQRLSVEIWQAFSAKRQLDLTRARAVLVKVLEQAARLDAVAPLAEERVFLAELIEHQRIGQYLEANHDARQMLRRLRDTGLPNSELGVQSGLSRRETKVLLMIAEGSSNKFIAHALGLSEATVKFHLSNVYRKLGCARRREAIIAARALGLVR
jgi:ATP/maltotriose-dependent transcriptional regulator MalT